MIRRVETDYSRVNLIILFENISSQCALAMTLRNDLRAQ